GTGGLSASRRGWRGTSCCGLCLCSGDRGQEDSLPRGEDGGGHHALGCVSAQGTGGLAASRRGWRGTSCSGLCLCSGDRRTRCLEERMEGDIMLWAGTGGLSASGRGWRGTSCSGLWDRRTRCLEERMEGDIMLWAVSLLRGQEDSLPRGEDGGGHHALGCVSAQGTGGLSASGRGWRGTSCSGLCLCSGDRRTRCLEERMEGDIMLWARFLGRPWDVRQRAPRSLLRQSTSSSILQRHPRAFLRDMWSVERSDVLVPRHTPTKEDQPTSKSIRVNYSEF
ncbi:hypothetical protein KUCAC02_034440, partial [Chaenocephalus aceratus]